MSGEAMSTPPAEPVLKVETREELVYLLGQACELEHGLMCEYLYAQFSLKRGLDEGLTPAQLDRVKAWEAALISVIKQEMLHLALSTNILTAVGAAPHFERPNFPILSRWYPPGVQIALVGVAQEWRTVGHLYRGIEAGLAYLCDRYGEDAVFIGPTRAQAVTDIFEWPELIAVTDLASVGRAIETIVEQGEGARGDWIRSHFGTFVGVLEDLLAVREADSGFNPARPVEPAFVRLPPDVESGTLIEDPVTARVADLPNVVYEVVLQVLSRYYIHHGESAAEFDVLARTAKHLMNWVMRALGPVLNALPVGPSHPGATAGPTFDIARPAIFLLPHQDAAWKIIKERLDALEQACASLGSQAGLGALAPLAGKLRSMSQDIATHGPNSAA